MKLPLGVVLLCAIGIGIEGQLPYKCDFESVGKFDTRICSFLSNSRNNKENWKIGKGKLNEADSGPSTDHTIGTINGTYLFVNVSAAKTNPVALQTVTLKGPYCVRFFYHMYGADIGDLTVTTQSVKNERETVRLFTRSKTQGDRWKEALFSIREQGTMKSKGYTVVFTASHKTASQVRGDIALDDIELNPGFCKEGRNDAHSLCSFDDYSCGYSALDSSIEWQWKALNSRYDSYPKIPSVDHTLSTATGGYWFVGSNGSLLSNASGPEAVNLYSPIYKSPTKPLNCLQFYYYIDGDGRSWAWGSVREAYIQAHINYPQTKERTWVVTKGKNVTDHRKWTYVEANVNITKDFQIHFDAVIQSPVEAVLAIDDVKIFEGLCPEAGSCDFEDDKCTWTDGEGDYNWVRKSGGSNVNNEIGPVYDKTKETTKGNYVVFSTRKKLAGSVANLESDFFPPGDDELCISFYYNIKGKNVGTLKVIRKEENITESTLWMLKDDQGGEWKKGMVAMKPSIMHNQVVFRGITGQGSNAYMALDDIKIRKGEKCVLTPPTADLRTDAISRLSCTFDNLNLCSWIQDKSTLQWMFGNNTPVESIGPKQPVDGKGHYIFVSSYKGTQSNNETVARLQSPVVNSFYPDSACFSFYYHMFGVQVGELRVYLVAMKDSNTPLGRQAIWRRRGTHPDKWFKFTDSLNVTEGDYRIEIEAEGGTGFAGDIAIDEMMMVLGECLDVQMCDFESSLCGWNIEGNDTFSWARTFPFPGSIPKGPDLDHTTQTTSGYFLQAIGDDGAKPEEITNLVSRNFGQLWGKHCLTFWYYRPGLFSGKISVLTRLEKRSKIQWEATTDVGRFWRYGHVTIKEIKAFRLVFEAERGQKGDFEMALDDILIQNTECGPTASCDFNSGYCSYFLNETSDFSWLLGTGRVVNTQLVDPPPIDNSLEDGMYVYADMTSPNLKEGQTSDLVSEILEVPSKGVSCLTFFYHMNGEDKSTLNVGKLLLENTNKEMQYKSEPLWSTNDNTGKGWTRKTVNVPGPAGGSQQVYFRATRGSGARSFIAIDDVFVDTGVCDEVTCADLNCKSESTTCSEESPKCECKPGYQNTTGESRKCKKKCDPACDTEKNQVCMDGSCVCMEGYELNGHQCTKKCDPACVPEKNQVCMGGSCVCMEGYELNGHQCTRKCDPACDTEKHQICRDGSCVCMEGYELNGHNCRKTCSRHSDCKNGGLCERSGEIGFCKCHFGYIGDYCETNALCETLNPSCYKAGASCVVVNKQAVCQCPEYQTYDVLSGTCQDACLSNLCVQGSCVSKMNSYECKCYEGYTGRYCGVKETKSVAAVWLILILVINFTIFSLLTGMMYYIYKKKP